MQTVFILVPSPHATGPVKGAYALANAIIARRRVVLVFLKSGPGVDAILDKRVEVVSLAHADGWFGRVRAYRKLLIDAGGRSNAGSISMCLSADLVNSLCSKQAATCSSVRGNLFRNYYHDYGYSGLPLAFAHLQALRAFDRVVAMTQVMADQINRVTGLHPDVIGNFVDELALDAYRQTFPKDRERLRFVFVGSLTKRKRPELAVAAMNAFRNQNVHLDVIGDGPLRMQLEGIVRDMELGNHVRLHGHLADPYPFIADADVFVLPSSSEGVSRAALEALHLGLPCVLRKVDGNAELLEQPEAGTVFDSDEDLVPAMIRAAAISRERTAKTTLLPEAFRQIAAADQYVELLERSRS